MDEPYDLKSSLLTSKANELTIGFAGFVKPGQAGEPDVEGVVKVSAFCRPNGSGYLTLTFVVDHETDAAGDLGGTTEGALREHLGSNFDMLIDIPLDEFAAPSPYRIKEMDVYFHKLRGQERKLAEGGVFPALSQLLGLQFEPLHVWTAGANNPRQFLGPVPGAP